MNRDEVNLSASFQAPHWLEFKGIAKTFGAHTAVDGIDLAVRKGEFLCLLGPSGCGKTTLLRILAGLERQDRGNLQMGGREIGHLPPAQRNYGIVFQSYALFPNLSVAANVAYGLRTGRDAKIRRVNELLDLVGLGGSAEKFPAQLSGGQQQRVALARALATSPSLLLLDEPLSALDAQVREHLRTQLCKLQEKLGVTTIMVTHDQEEALALADTIAVMNRGRIEQFGTPEQIYREPASRFVAEFVGRANWLPVRMAEDGLIRLGETVIASNRDIPNCPNTQAFDLFCRPEDVRIEANSVTDARSLIAKVERVDFMGSVRRVTLSIPAVRDLNIMVDVGAGDPVCQALQAERRFSISFALHNVRAYTGAGR